VRRAVLDHRADEADRSGHARLPSDQTLLVGAATLRCKEGGVVPKNACISPLVLGGRLPVKLDVLVDEVQVYARCFGVGFMGRIQVVTAGNVNYATDGVDTSGRRRTLSVGLTRVQRLAGPTRHELREREEGTALREYDASLPSFRSLRAGRRS